MPVGTGTAPVPADQAALTSIVLVNRPGWLQAIVFIDIDGTSFGSPAPSGALQRELHRQDGGEG